MPAVLKIRFVLYSILLLIILVLLNKAILPFGKITYKVTPCDNSFFIQKLHPKDRVSVVDKKTCTQRVSGEPVYFNLNTQRTFNEADATITYRNSGQNNVIEMGVQADARKNYRLQPLENKIIDSLNWDKISENGVTLLQKNKIYNSVDAFLNNLPPKSEIATYHYDLPTQATIPNYQPNNQPVIIKQPLRGSYQFYTYVDGPTAEFEFLFSDLNNNKDADNVALTLYDMRNNPVTVRNIVDERGGEEMRQAQDAGGLHLELTTLAPGFYKMEMAATDDIVTTQILSSQKILSFINRLWLADSSQLPPLTKGRVGVGYTLYTDAGEITASTLNPAALQKILINHDVLNLDETYRQFSVPANEPLNTIQFAHDDVIISGAGIFSFSPESLYNPNYRKISKNQNLDSINYIITTYQPQPNAAGEWRTKTLHFDLKNAFRYKHNYNFILSVPGLIAGDHVDDYVEIKNIKINLQGRSLWEKVFN
ncbi:hypothetical protein A2477_03080 [Candidatus Falkowbacteria bacterium RIFOXYC2_FULL_47_12]|uniref:Uncharacterized protein n=1 Tax=Candidatus Falkowbacteria bacterium RIFOXYC2_FULL_47_12 TaxID=1798004 RepID=A0A1F5TRA5_9BACT|nr:MAG: hypothetical protein A2477_03080 [Candidatus Falkowbacteria bacterium RIFOXYC2_FULL_47_12]